MGRPPCCDKVGVKKGPWTPEEDIMLVSYVQEHGPGNWRSVPTNTGLRRCSKSCRLRWTNYLRPGIRRGDFTDDEEKMIISLQALLGNKWAAIASYLPERTDNDIKNYWNTHLKKKLKKLQMGVSAGGGGDPAENRHDGALSKNSGGLSSTSSSSSSHYISRGQWEKRLQTDINLAKQALNEALSLDKPSNFSSLLFDSPDQFFTKPPPAITRPTTAATTYASSTENIAKLLKGFMKNTPPKRNTVGATVNHHLAAVKSEVNSSSACCNSTNSSVDDGDKTNGGIDLSEAFESLFGFESFDSNSNNNSDFSHQSNYTSPEGSNLFQGESKTPPLQLAMFENWLLEEAAAGGGGGCHVHVKTDHLTTNFSFEESAADFFED